MQNNTRKFNKDDIEHLAYEEGGLPGFEFVNKEMTDTDDWSHYFTVVFKHNGVFYAFDYSQGATEIQDYTSWDSEPDMVECYQVKPVQKTVTEYARV